MSFALLLALLPTSWAQNQDCNLVSLRAELEAASPIAVPEVYVRLAGCDAKLGAKTASAALTRTLPGDAGYAAAEAAIDVGAGDAVRAWVSAMPSDEKSRAIAHLGGKCAADPAVATFLVETHKVFGEVFWSERWYRGMADCRVRAVQDLLVQSIDGDVAGVRAKERPRFHSVLEVYARNLGPNALPKLIQFASTFTEREDLLPVIGAFADAAQVGAAGGMDSKTAEVAAAELEKLAVNLPPFAIPQVRETLRALGAEAASDQVARFRWPDRYHEGYSYAVVAVEDYVCKGERKQSEFQFAFFTEAGMMWPEQVAAMIPEKIAHEWQLNPSARCKGGEGTYQVEMSPEPFGSVEEAHAWVESKRKAWTEGTAGYHKVHETDRPIFRM